MTSNVSIESPGTSVRSKGHSSRLPYLPALDGLRALAVIAVLFYHANLQWMPGGFLGVEIFFTISGYLITSLLLSEWRETNRIVLKNFWLRRARRLLPALFTVVIAALAVSVVFFPDEVASLRNDALAAFGYSTNWYLIFSHKSYFETMGRPSLLQHLWSLAVEEQFYVLWPLFFVFTMRRWRESRVLTGVLAVALTSTLLMAVLYQPDIDPSRVYYGTDTRAAGILIGVALAFVWAPGRTQGRADKLPLNAIGFAALAALLVFCLKITEFAPFLYRGGFALVAISTAILIAASVHPKSKWVQAVLGFSVLRWVGLRSYGIYLWHWPVFMLTRPQLDTSLDGLPLLALRFTVTLILAELSFRLVETPVRSGALERSWQTLRRAEGRQRRQLVWRWGSATTVILVFSVALGSSVVRAQPPPPPAFLAEASTQAAVLPVRDVPFHEGSGPRTPSPTSTVTSTATPATPTPAVTLQPAVAMTAALTITPASRSVISLPIAMIQPNPADTTAATHSISATETSSATDTVAPSTATPRPTELSAFDEAERLGSNHFDPTPAPTATPTPIGHITAIGDSVMLGAASVLREVFPGIDVDAEVGRQMYRPTADLIINEIKDGQVNGTLGSIVVLHLGNNGVYPKESFDRLMQALSDRWLVIVFNVRVPRQWQDNNNQVIEEGVKQYPNAVLIDWFAATKDHPELFWSDGHHLRPEGARFYASLIMDAIRSH